MAKQATPRARQIAKQHNIDLETVEGTGANGYIVPKDVEALISTRAETTNGKAPKPVVIPEREHVPPASDKLLAELENVALPVSVLFKLRFRQDFPGTEKPAGKDLLGIRAATVGGTYRSDPSILGWFVADRGMFAEAKPKQKLSLAEGQGRKKAKAEPTSGDFGVTS